MQPLAMYAIVLSVVVVVGVSAALALTRRGGRRRPTRINRWHLHGSIPFAGAALAFGAISRSSCQTPATHSVLVVLTDTMLLGAFLCALYRAIAATRQRPSGNRA
jgi:hypothetical protein